MTKPSSTTSDGGGTSGDRVVHLIKEQTKGVMTTKCGKKSVSIFDVTVWWGEVTCSKCRPFQWTEAPDGNGRMMVQVGEIEKPPRRIVKVRE